ncbi:unnamed protein product [Trichogramma brassicae]|uniref:C2H2-type domain-containing protein n=1 Tax=Trichogramma brassicae TaxID=86971 RepID=A0A6H5JAC6_9HYME|nr:unnamed protein product [Trichogramma brassicae]
MIKSTHCTIVNEVTARNKSSRARARVSLLYITQGPGMYVFGRKSPLLDHQKTVHEGHKDYRCDRCEKVFGTKWTLLKHQKLVHEDLPIVRNSPTISTRCAAYKKKSAQLHTPLLPIVYRDRLSSWRRYLTFGVFYTLRGHRNVVIVAIVPLVRDIYGLYTRCIRDDDRIQKAILAKKPQWKCGIFSTPMDSMHPTICSLITTTIATTIRRRGSREEESYVSHGQDRLAYI